MTRLFSPPEAGKEELAYCMHVITAIDEIQSIYVPNCEDHVVCLAIERLMAIIGEALDKISPKIKARYTDISWSDAKKMRNWVIHGYFGLNQSILEQTIEDDLPVLKKQVLDIMKQLKQE